MFETAETVYRATQAAIAERSRLRAMELAKKQGLLESTIRAELKKEIDKLKEACLFYFIHTYYIAESDGDDDEIELSDLTREEHTDIYQITLNSIADSLKELGYEVELVQRSSRELSIYICWGINKYGKESK